MAAAPNTDDKALATILDCLRYAERELALLSAPIPGAADLARQAVQVIERRLAPSL